MPKVVLVLPKTGYRNEDFLAAAERLGLEVIAASDVCHQLADIWEETPVALRFRDAEAAAEELARGVRDRRPVAVVGVDDLTALVAALAAERLGLAQNPPAAVAAARSKALSRRPRGHSRVLALFDKPDPLDGPYFEETLYVTPSRHPAALQDAVAREVSRACDGLGLVEGPVHAELRLSPAGPRILEVAARSIGGLCGRALRFGVGVTLEELILRHALRMTGDPPPREKRASGVVMLPIRRRGVLEEVRGVEEARHVPLVEDVAITAHLREELVPLPEGASYLGFAFARGETPEQVEQALRQAAARIEAVVTPRLSVT